MRKGSIPEQVPTLEGLPLTGQASLDVMVARLVAVQVSQALAPSAPTAGPDGIDGRVFGAIGGKGGKMK
jgi:hypothetical protein